MVSKVVMKSFNHAIGLRMEGGVGDVVRIEEKGKLEPRRESELGTAVGDESVWQARL